MPLDAVGNKPRQSPKAMPLPPRVWPRLSFLPSFTQIVGAKFTFSLSDPKVLVGLIIGGLSSLCFRRLCDGSGRACLPKVLIRKSDVNLEKLKNNESTTKTEYGKAVDIVTKAALREMILPAAIPVVAPILAGFTWPFRSWRTFLSGNNYQQTFCGNF